MSQAKDILRSFNEETKNILKALNEDSGDVVRYYNPSDYYKFKKSPVSAEDFSVLEAILEDALERLRPKFEKMLVAELKKLSAKAKLPDGVSI